ncbi:hypothetical protein GYMLUDRAFT_1016707 [Collybiopsis luxurians FD-317 M1]|uniref:SH3 domain-containing protein n=1 Tax=Collybiopsis luxurians FD-317 M1 TaxID=944289 RepID=A0A0D0AZH9_9AGAR|nr:hypothetical protein GYMLUDRAFT_1016707 [Collybiopsis luxurians FD-317 M1]
MWVVHPAFIPATPGRKTLLPPQRCLLVSALPTSGYQDIFISHIPSHHQVQVGIQLKLEIAVPVASAIAEATAAKSSTGGSSESDSPILPLRIISTSSPGIALMDYKKRGEEELDLVKDDVIRVFKRYNHWSYAVKEDGGDRGWILSWLVGKVTPEA